MLSRRHVRIDFSGSEPSIEDLRSRNGTQLNGRPLTGRATLRGGDRIRVGTQELVFLTTGVPKTDFRTTSGLTFCVGCAVPFPSASAQCPHCGAVAKPQDTRSSTRDVGSTGWTFHLLSQVVRRAMEQGRLADAERMMSRGVAELDDQLDGGIAVEQHHVADLAECATRLGSFLQSPRWLEVGARLYRRAGEPPSSEVLGLLEGLPADEGLANAVSLLRGACPQELHAG